MTRDLEKANEATFDFIDTNYSSIFGHEEMGDPSAELTKDEVVGLLNDFHKHLHQAGVTPLEHSQTDGFLAEDFPDTVLVEPAALTGLLAMYQQGLKQQGVIT